MHILLSANQAWNIVNFRKGLIKAFVKAGYKVSVVVPPDPSVEELKTLGCEVHFVPLSPSGVNPLSDLKYLWGYFRALRKAKPDLVINYTIKPNIYGSIAAALARVPSLAVTTGLGYTFINANASARIARWLYRIALKFPRQVWFLNPDDMATFLEHKLVDRDRARLLNGEGVDVDYYGFSARNDPGDGCFRFLLVARMLWDKGIAEYVSAAGALKKKYPNAVFQLLGAADVDNPSAVSVETIRRWEKDGLVEYLGTTEDVRPMLEAADCVVLPSYREGVPRTLLEAAAVGRPIVTTDAAGCREVVKEGVNGYLCQPRDASDLGRRMEDMMTLTGSARADMGRHGRTMVETQFAEKIVLQAYFSAIPVLLAGTGALRQHPTPAHEERDEESQTI